MPSQVLLITYANDGPADLVVEAIRARGWEPVRFDTDRFPAEVDLVLRQGRGRPPSFVLRDGTREVELSHVRSIWYRRFYSARLPDTVEPKYVQYSRSEARTLLSALFATLRDARWVDPIPNVHRAHHKLLQMEIAQAAGFPVPDTLATSDPVAARRFYEEHRGNVVTKMLNSISFVDDGSEQMVFTSQVTEAHLQQLDGLRICPAEFQERVEKDVELRVAVVGRRIFAASIDTRGHPEAEVDWRQDLALTTSFEKATLPAEVEQRVFRVMDAFGLTYGSLDIIRRPDGEHVFLEINSAGEWGWLAQAVGLPIPQALADELTGAPAP